MTQDEIIEMYMQVSKELCNDTEWCWAGVGEPLQMFAKLVAAKEREALAQEKTLQALHSENERLGLYKDAYAQPQQEPVAWVVYSSAENDIVWADKGKRLKQNTPLYTTPSQPEQEPVAYLCENAVGHKYFRWKKPSSTYKPIALYTTPPQRTWVGLTDEEVRKICVNEWGGYEQCRAIEAKLKEKNSA